MIRMLLSRPWIFNIAVVGFVLALVYIGTELTFYWLEENKMEDLRQEKRAAAGKWFVEEGVSKRFGGQAFIMASANSGLVDGDHFYDLSLICYGPGETEASLIILVYKVTITPHGLSAYPLGAGDRAKLVKMGGSIEQSLELRYAAASEALEIGFHRDGQDVPEEIFAGRYSKEFPLMIRGMDGNVVFVDRTAVEQRARRRVLDACSSESTAE